MRDLIINQIDKLNVWSRTGERAPHKPLLLLLAISQLKQGKTAISFSECEEKLTQLLREFSPSRHSYHPEYPFWRLQKDGLWNVTSSIPMNLRKGNADIPKRQLRLGHAVGSIPENIRSKLLANPSLMTEVVNRLLDAHFPETLHQDILNAVGLSLDQETGSLLKRDPQFRSRVLIAYEYRCALCGLDIRIGNVTIALEAAHIRWHQAGGPDTEDNGIAFCSLHHKIFDLGAFTIHTDYRVLVSEMVHGAGQFEEILLRHHGQEITKPSRPENVPLPQYLRWHRSEVFKEGARFLEGMS